MIRSYKAGKAFGEAVIEMVNLMYQKRTAGWFYVGFYEALNVHFASACKKKKRNKIKKFTKNLDKKFY